MGMVKHPRAAEPPPRRRGSPERWTAVLSEVAEMGVWAEVGRYTTVQAASAVAKRVRKTYDPAGRFELTSRTVDGRGVLYARLKPEADRG